MREELLDFAEAVAIGIAIAIVLIVVVGPLLLAAWEALGG